MNLSSPFIRLPVMTMLLVVSVVLFGAMAYRTLPVSDLPPVDYPVIQVTVNYPGATPETMANNVATPLEQQFLQIPGLEQITSASSQGHTALTVQFALSKTIDSAATDVQAAISRASGELPTDLPNPPTFTKVNPNEQPIFYIGLLSDSVTAADLYEYAKIQVGQTISIVPGVSQVAVFGTQPAVRIMANPSALAVRNLTMDDLTNAIRNNTSYVGAGQFDSNHTSLLLQPQGQLEDASQYEQLIVSQPGQAPIYLKDVAKASDSVQDQRISMRFWIRGQKAPNAAVVVAVYRQLGSNTVEVANAVRELLPHIQVTLPGSVTLIPIHDRSETVVSSINDVKTTLYIAFFLVVGVIYLFLGRATDTIIPAVAMPLSLLLVFIVMEARGYSLDNLSLMGLTLVMGFLVDDAIVFLENTVRRMEQFGETAPGGHEQQRLGNQLHDSFHDALAGGGVHSAGVHERADRPDLSRILHHYCVVHPGLGAGIADADADDGFAPGRSARRRGKENGRRAHDGGDPAARAGCVRPFAVVVPAP